MCSSGVGLTPVIDGKLHHFSAGGLYNGLVLLIDDETGTYWDHITGEAVHGRLVGQRMEYWGIEMTTAGALRHEAPNLILHRSQQSLKTRIMGWFMNRPFMRGRFPPGFRGTMQEVDDRLEEMCIGLGIVTGSTSRFYPKHMIGAGLTDTIDGQNLVVGIGEPDQVPYAEWADGSRPLQLFSRWYGFVLTYPGCEIYQR